MLNFWWLTFDEQTMMARMWWSSFDGQNLIINNGQHSIIKFWWSTFDHQHLSVKIWWSNVDRQNGMIISILTGWTKTCTQCWSSTFGALPLIVRTYQWRSESFQIDSSGAKLAYSTFTQKDASEWILKNLHKKVMHFCWHWKSTQRGHLDGAEWDVATNSGHLPRVRKFPNWQKSNAWHWLRQVGLDKLAWTNWLRQIGLDKLA